MSNTKPTPDRIAIAREAILQDLKRRWKEHRDGTVMAAADISRFHKPQTNYFSGSGTMKCPVCGSGNLRYSRSSYNGHVNAVCGTDGCVMWME